LDDRTDVSEVGWQLFAFCLSFLRDKIDGTVVSGESPEVIEFPESNRAAGVLAARTPGGCPIF